ncbi:MAG: SH3 domain-containing protein [Chloroflexi bacterium]|nr:SH3 domain-containing protein [Chloroflexota bacterium]
MQPTPTETVALEVLAPQAAPAPAGPPTGASRPPAAAAPAAPGRQEVGNTGGLGANLRAAPGTEAKVLAALPEGTALDPLDRANDASGRVWLKVRDPRGMIGWVAQEYVKRKA